MFRCMMIIIVIRWIMNMIVLVIIIIIIIYNDKGFSPLPSSASLVVTAVVGRQLSGCFFGITIMLLLLLWI